MAIEFFQEKYKFFDETFEFIACKLFFLSLLRFHVKPYLILVQEGQMRIGGYPLILWRLMCGSQLSQDDIWKKKFINYKFFEFAFSKFFFCNLICIAPTYRAILNSSPYLKTIQMAFFPRLEYIKVYFYEVNLSR